jgi:hypothetical protein
MANSQKKLHCPECQCLVRSDRLENHLLKAHRKILHCPECQCLVRSDRLEKHLLKAHKIDKPAKVSSLTIASDKSKSKEESKPSKLPLDPQIFDEIANLIGSWLRKNKEYFCRDEYIITLTLMFLEKTEGYSFDQVMSVHKEEVIDREKYEQCSLKLVSTYELISHNILKKQRRITRYNQSIHSANASESSDYANWYECNTVDPMDGSKYIGYTAREYESSRYGSYPIHDDYGDESWADGNPWE